MRRTSILLTAVLVLTASVALGGVRATGAVPPRAPAEFFGIGPQSVMTEKDAEYMKAGGIGVVRLAIPWSSIQSSRRGGYNWTGLDEAVAVAARAGLRVMPFFWGTPHWVAAKPTILPIDSARAREAWKAFVIAAVQRYGPGGEFWVEHGKHPRHTPTGPSYETGGPEYAPAPTPRNEAPIRPLPIRTWQVWNEANFYYFATPTSPTRYARLLKITTPTIKAIDPGAKVILSGLFARPTASYPRGMNATVFLNRLYNVPGIKPMFDGVSLHPYAVDTETLEEYVEAFHEVTVQHHDRVPLYITEMGWGSQPDFQKVAFEQGIQGQVRELKGAYTYLLENRHRLDVKQVYWFSWKDIRGDCNFCDSVGLFHEGKGFRPKPAWRAFITLAHGRARP